MAFVGLALLLFFDMYADFKTDVRHKSRCQAHFATFPNSAYRTPFPAKPASVPSSRSPLHLSHRLFYRRFINTLISLNLSRLSESLYIAKWLLFTVSSNSRCLSNGQGPWVVSCNSFFTSFHLK